MNILVLQGSSRCEKGITDSVTRRFITGILEGNPSAKIETEYLAKKNIDACRGCLSCWLKTSGVCRIQDDMAVLIDKYKKSDIVIAAAPLYFDSMSSHTKKFWERLLPVLSPYFEKGPFKVRHRMREDVSKGLFVISTCAMPEVEQFDALTLSYQRIAYNLNMNYLGQLLRPESHSLTFKKEYGDTIDSVFDSIQESGKELIKNLNVSHETINKAQQPIIKDPEEFIRVNNGKWNKAGIKA